MCHQMSSVTKVSPSSKLCHPLSLMFVNAVSTVFLNTYWIISTEFRHSMVTSDVMKIALISIFWTPSLSFRNDRQSKNSRRFQEEMYKRTDIVNEFTLIEIQRSKETIFKMQNMVLFVYSVAFVAGNCENEGFVLNLVNGVSNAICQTVLYNLSIWVLRGRFGAKCDDLKLNGNEENVN